MFAFLCFRLQIYKRFLISANKTPKFFQYFFINPADLKKRTRVVTLKFFLKRCMVGNY